MTLPTVALSVPHTHAPHSTVVNHYQIIKLRLDQTLEDTACLSAGRATFTVCYICLNVTV